MTPINVLPNTFYAKGGITTDRLSGVLMGTPYTMARILGLGQAVGGWWGGGAAWITFVGLLIIAVWQRAISRQTVSHLILLAAAVAAYLLLPEDWMGEWRYAVPAIVLWWLTFGHLCADVLGHRVERVGSAPVTALLLGTAGLTAFSWFPRIEEFRDRPALPLREVDLRAVSFENCATLLDIEKPSILTQDVGGFLLRNRLRIFDAGMLTDKRIAYDLGEWRVDPDRADFHNYVFDELKPTFISLAAFHAWRANLPADPRLSRDYESVRVAIDPWIARRFGEQVPSGDYVRRSVLRSEDQVGAIRRILQAAYEPQS